MPRTIEHIVETHQIAAARRAAGQDIWDRRIRLSDIFHNTEMSFEERRDAIVLRIRNSRWADENETVAELLGELADTETEDEFNGPWDAIYDEADYDRVWIATV